MADEKDERIAALTRLLGELYADVRWYEDKKNGMRLTTDNQRSEIDALLSPRPSGEVPAVAATLEIKNPCLVCNLPADAHFGGSPCPTPAPPREGEWSGPVKVQIGSLGNPVAEVPTPPSHQSPEEDSVRGRFAQGCRAFDAGQPMSANPYPKGTEQFFDWQGGWQKSAQGPRPSPGDRGAEVGLCHLCGTRHRASERCPQSKDRGAEEAAREYCARWHTDGPNRGLAIGDLTALLLRREREALGRAAEIADKWTERPGGFSASTVMVSKQIARAIEAERGGGK